MPLDIMRIARDVNAHAKTYATGYLQDIRASLRGFSKRPASDIFTSLTISENFAFHHGGRRELQFNIGREGPDGREELRHGVAFSLEPSQALPDIGVLVPKIRLFNDYLMQYPERFADMRMWHFRRGERSSDAAPGLIPPELVEQGNFIFLGKRQAAADVDVHVILRDFDRLLPLFRYVEGEGKENAAQPQAERTFRFSPGLRSRPSVTVASHTARMIDVNLRHNLLQEALARKLAAKFGSENVAVEQPTGRGTLIDVAVRHPDGGLWFYEIKTACTAQACIREALGQVLEYAYWPGAQEPRRIIVCGEGWLDDEGSAYLKRLKDGFGLPVHYERVVLDGESGNV